MRPVRSAADKHNHFSSGRQPNDFPFPVPLTAVAEARHG
jgi:hypothetical protein